jgi:hypothetical protein
MLFIVPVPDDGYRESFRNVRLFRIDAAEKTS